MQNISGYSIISFYVTFILVAGKYIADFVCMDKKLIIELDGSQHLENENVEYDKERTEYLLKSGYKVVRIFNNDISKNINGVLGYILQEYTKL